MKPDLRTTCCTYSPLKTFCTWAQLHSTLSANHPLEFFSPFALQKASVQSTKDNGPNKWATRLPDPNYQAPNASLMTAFETVREAPKIVTPLFISNPTVSPQLYNPLGSSWKQDTVLETGACYVLASVSRFS